MKKYIVIVLIISIWNGFNITSSQAQTYGNEWIDYNQTYLKFAISKTQVYRINYTTLYAALQKVGVSLADINPRNIKIYGRGAEIPLYIAGESDQQFDTNDYIEFYAQHNDGWYDEKLYPSANSHVNPYYSLFTDTAYYFLTWGNTSGLRYTVETDTQFSVYNEHNRIYVTRILYSNAYYCTGAYKRNYTVTPYKPAEGWMDSRISLGGTSKKTFSTTNADKTYPTVDLEYAFAGVNNPNNKHHMKITLGNNLLMDTLYQGVSYIRGKALLSSSVLGATSTVLNFQSVNDQGNSTCYQSIVYAKMTYAHTFQLESGVTSYTFTADNLQGAKTVFPFISSSIGAKQDEIVLYDLTHHLRIPVIKNANTLKAVVPNYNSSMNGYLTSTAEMLSINELYPVGANGKFADIHNYVNTDYFIVSGSSLMGKAQSYADYRNHLSPYRFTAEVFDVNELYDEFAYGIKNNPIAIRNLINYACAAFNTRPEYLFLIGRAYTATAGRKNSGTFNATIVPTMGSIPSDYAITMGLGDTSEFFCIPTGRLSTSSSVQVDWYKQKVQEFEAAQRNPQAWMKQILHFGGGSNAVEQRTFAGYLNNYKNIAVRPFMGAKVNTFLKTNSDPIEINMSDSLRNLINSGVAMMTFFGHAGGTGFDISIDDPEEYSNQGKYFVMLGNSCYAGNIFEGSNNYSEKFINIANKGAIAYVSPSATGHSVVLNATCSEFYSQLCNKSYGKSLGYCIQKALKYVTDNFGREYMDYTLNGDPCLKICAADKPDYVITKADVKTGPEIISSELDSFIVNLQFINQGKLSDDSFYVCVERFFPDQTSVKKYIRLKTNAFQTSLSVKFALEKALAPGKNDIAVTLDVLNEVEEHNESNNQAVISFTIVSADILPIYPYQYAIVPKDTLTLVASTDIQNKNCKCRFMIDTCSSFNSPALRTSDITVNNGIVEWELPFRLTDSTVYYWKVNKAGDTVGGKTYSFQYISRRSGCSQAHFSQFVNNTYLNVDVDTLNRNFSFTHGSYAYTAKTRFFNSLSEEAAYETEVYIKRNNVIFDQVQCVMVSRPFIHILVFDPVTGANWVNTETSANGSKGKYGQVLCRNYATNGFHFYMDDSVSREDVAIFLENIPTGYYVLIMSINHTAAHLFTEKQYQAWESVGSTQIRSLTAQNDYILFGKKGASTGDTCIRELVGSNNGQYLTMIGAEMQVPIGKASMQSEIFGPAKKWQTFSWEMQNNDISNGDTIKANIYGIDNQGNEALLISNINYSVYKDYNLVNKINADQYPYARVDINFTDYQNRTLPQMKRLQLYYEDVPETSVCGDNFYFYCDTIQQGDSLRISTSTKNVSSADMGNLLIKYSLIHQNNEVYTQYYRSDAHPAGTLLTDSMVLSTANLSGNNLLRVEYNPDNDQKEKYHYNNYIEVPFYVVGDSVNPVLDVTFDGYHIMDGELISAKPYIQITLKDENKFLLLNDISDTSKIKVYLKTPGAASYQYIPFYADNIEILQFVPAQNAQNKCQINYPAEFTEDGTYYLRVEANDKSNNASGANAYVVSFKIVNKSTITEIFNYPNPFSTRTQFVFTLTGSQLPTYMKIQILTISGKVVKEIDMSELGPLKIGNNITDYAWDGCDMYGNVLANGVYLYRVITRIQDKEVELNSQSNNTKAFKKGFGKMVIMR
ncbi:MAG: hypothetical protein J5701_01350 [Bacteroidales bacterium]|nr:hypothetical protein [Bacteroidales bacterium]